MTKTMTRLLLPSLALLFSGQVKGTCSCSFEEKKTVTQRLPPLREGDILFIAIPHPPFSHVARATSCPANHVGILFRDGGERLGSKISRGAEKTKARWVVAESGVPLSRYCPLEAFLARSEGGWCVVRRLKGGVTPEQARRLRAECDVRMNRFYHTGFRYDSGRQFCSKFVHDVYQNALGVKVGELETFADLLRRNPDSSLLFWKFWFFGRIPWERRTITPASQFHSKLLETVAGKMTVSCAD